MTQKKLAELAHVSVATVSKAFNHSPEISAETRNAIFDIAKKHGCFDKYYKEKYKKYVIAVICPEFQSEYYSDYLSILEREIMKRNATMIVGTADFSEEKARELLDYYATFAKVDGVILIESFIAEIGKYSLPIVSIGPSLSEDIFCIPTNSSGAIDDAARLFVQNGHKKIGYIGEKLTVKKEVLFKKTLKKYGIECRNEFFVRSDKRFEKAGFSGMEQIFNTGDFPTAILCAYDNIAIGAIHSIKKHGLSVPDDISIIGMNNIEEISYIDNPLTSISIHKNLLCTKSLDILFRQFENPHYKPTDIETVEATLLIRESVKNIKR